MKQYRKYLILSFLLFFMFLRLNADEHIIQADRRHEVILADAEGLSSLIGQDIESIKIYRYLSTADTWEPVPFQIDELKDFSFSSKQSGVFEDSDQILFMARDLGDKASSVQWVDDDEAKSHKRLALIFIDPLTQDTGMVYLFQSRDLTGSGVQYLTYDEQEDFVESGDYFISHGKYGLQDFILFKPSCGGDSIDFFDTQKVRFKIRIVVDMGIFGKIKKSVLITEETKSKTIYIVGFPLNISFKNIGIYYSCTGTIRLQRTAIFEIKVEGKGIGVHESSELNLKTNFFPHYTEWKADEITIPEFDDGSIRMIRFSSDLNEKSKGMMFYNEYNQSGVRIDGKSSSVDNSIEWDYNWYLISVDTGYGDSELTTGSILSVMDLKGSILGDEQELWFCDDASFNLIDTGDRICYGDVGVNITGSSITGELSFLNRTYYIPENLTYTDAAEEIEKDKHPLEMNVQSQYPLNITVIPPQGGHVEVKSFTDSAFAYNIVRLTAVPENNYEFDYWSGDYSGTADTVQILMDSPKNINVHFIPLREITITTNPSGMDFTADGETYTAAQFFQWREGSVHELGIDSLIQPDENTRYIFSEWSTGDARCFNYTVPEFNEEITGDFLTEFKIYATVNIEDAGSVVLTPPGEWFKQGSQVKFQAFPQGWYTFIRWSGDLNEEENPVTVSIDSSLRVEAIFGNYPPVVALPDTFFNEDDTLTLSFDSFDLWISDENNPDSTLKVYFHKGNHINFFSDSSFEEIKIFSIKSNWYGIDSLLIQAEDPLAERGEDFFKIEVLSRADPPGEFSLISPADNFEISVWPDSVHFTWQDAYDPDPGDSVSYKLELDTTRNFNSLHLMIKEDIPVSRYDMAWLDTYPECIYFWQVTAVDNYDSTAKCRDIFSFHLNTGIDDNSSTVPDKFFLDQNYPNPFNQNTVLRYGLPAAANVKLFILNSSGQRVRTLISGNRRAGFYSTEWNGADENRTLVSSGIYFIILRTDGFMKVRKVLLLK